MNPRKLAKHGFINSDMNTISCSSCKFKVRFGPDFNFSCSEDKAKDKFDKIRRAHQPGCLFKKEEGQEGTGGAAKFPLPEFGSSSLQPEKFVINSRKLVYLRWQEILVALLKSYEGIVIFPKIDEKAISALRGVMFPDKFTKLKDACNKMSSIVFPDSTEKLGDGILISVPGLLALCGWRAINKNEDRYILECSSCLRKLDSKVLVSQGSYTQSFSQIYTPQGNNIRDAK